MLTKNIDLSIGLVNGAIETVTHIQLPGVVSNNTMPQSVSVNFDASKTVTSGDKVVEVQPVTTRFFGLSNSVWQRTQLPLKPCWAATVHKVQGLTLSRAVVDIGEAVFQAGMACSSEQSKITSRTFIDCTLRKENICLGNSETIL